MRVFKLIVNSQRMNKHQSSGVFGKMCLKQEHFFCQYYRLTNVFIFKLFIFMFKLQIVSSFGKLIRYKKCERTILKKVLYFEQLFI